LPPGGKMNRPKNQATIKRTQILVQRAFNSILNFKQAKSSIPARFLTPPAIG
jgi:hypothetical protein